MAGMKLAYMRIRAKTCWQNWSQLRLWQSISRAWVAKALTTCTPAMFSVIRARFSSPARITAS
jgi:hypothetical protein